ncbi:MAG: cyclase dehydrase [Alphaproteobacteria bacterium]|nr:cyclase dehydrase [Alphaproteobacteria bacterium]
MSNVPRTALPGCSRSANDQMAKGLGYFSIALGLSEVIAAGAISRAAGLNGLHGLVRGYGGREIANGLAILTSHDPTTWVWGRVAGDVTDIATVAAGAEKMTKPRTLLALAMLAGVTALDVVCATRLAAEKGSRNSARTDYYDRSGFPKGLQAARGAARSFEAPRDFRTPDALRPHGQQQESREAAATTTPAASI